MLIKIDYMIKAHLFALLVISLSTMAAYSTGLKGAWLFDDQSIFNGSISFDNIRDLLGARRFTFYTFYLNERFLPFESLYFRFVNVVIHIFNAVLVYLLVIRSGSIQDSLSDERLGAKRKDDTLFYMLALIAGLVFALHPININAVAYISQRATSFACLFTLLALHLYISASLSHGIKCQIFYYSAALLFIALGIISKENAVLAIPLLLLYDLFFISRFSLRIFLKRIAFAAVMAVLAVAFAAYSLDFLSSIKGMLSIAANLDVPIAKHPWTAVDVYWTPLQHIMTEFRVITRYLLIILLPLPNLLLFDGYGYEVSKSLVEPLTTMSSVLMIAVLIVFALWNAKRLTYLSFGILWYFIAISLESFIALGSDIYFEHRNYLPLSGLLLGIALQVRHSLAGRDIKYSRVIITCVLLLCAALLSLTAYRNHIMKDPLSLWTDTLYKSPANKRAMLSVGGIYFSMDDLKSSEQNYKLVLSDKGKGERLDISYKQEARLHLGRIYILTSRHEDVLGIINQLERQGELGKTTILRGLYESALGNEDAAVHIFQSYQGSMSEAELLLAVSALGDIARKTNKPREALIYYNRALTINRGYVDAIIGMAEAYLSIKDIESSERHYMSALSIEPYNMSALTAQSYLMLIKGSEDEALKYAKRALEISKSSPLPFLAVGDIELFAGKELEADLYYKKAIERGAKERVVNKNKARIYLLKGDVSRAERILRESFK